MSETTKQTIVRKLTSRKLWISVAAFVSMLMIYRGADEGSADSVAAIIMAGGAVMAYVLGEGFVDAENARNSESEEE